MQGEFRGMVEQVTSLSGCVFEVCFSESSLLICAQLELECLSGRHFHFQPLAPKGRSIHQPGVENHQTGSSEFCRPSV